MILEPSHARCSAGRPHLPAGIRHNLAAVLFVTWNVNSLRARLPRVLELLEQHQPDVVALQETKCSPANFPVAELELAGYDAVHYSGGQWAGVALLFRRPLAPDMPLLGLPDDTIPSEARWCEATVAGTRFVSTYVPNGRALDSPEYPRKLAFLEAAAKRAAAIRMAAEGTSLVIAGDMNVAPADADVYDPATTSARPTPVSRSAPRSRPSRKAATWWTPTAMCIRMSSSSPGGTTAPATSTRI